MFVDYQKRIEKEVKALSHQKLVALSLICCKRLSPLYSEFSKTEEWGDDSTLELCRRAAESWLDGNEAPTKKLLSQIERVTPDTEDFGSVLGSFSLNAAASHAYLLEQIQNEECTPLICALQCCYDTVDFYVQELLDPNRKGGVLESDIDSHPAMVQELEWQFTKISEIRDCQNVQEYVRKVTVEPIIVFA